MFSKTEQVVIALFMVLGVVWALYYGITFGHRMRRLRDHIEAERRERERDGRGES